MAFLLKTIQVPRDNIKWYNCSLCISSAHKKQFVKNAIITVFFSVGKQTGLKNEPWRRLIMNKIKYDIHLKVKMHFSQESLMNLVRIWLHIFITESSFNMFQLIWHNFILKLNAESCEIFISQINLKLVNIGIGRKISRIIRKVHLKFDKEGNSESFLDKTSDLSSHFIWTQPGLRMKDHGWYHFSITSTQEQRVSSHKCSTCSLQ